MIKNSFLIALFSGLSVFATETSVPITLDIESGVRQASTDEVLAYDTRWFDVTNAEYRIRVNGVLLSSGNGIGDVNWNPEAVGNYALTYETFIDGVKVGEDMTAAFRIVGQDLVNADIRLDVDEVVSDGTPQTPKVSIVYGEKTLVEGVDDTLSYRDNVSYGVGTVVISGCGEYHDVVEQTFTILPGCVCTLDIESGVRQASADEVLAYDTRWFDVTNAEYRIRVNGVLLSSGSGIGDINWTPKAVGDYALTYETFIDGVKVGEDMTAAFRIVGQDLVDADIRLDVDEVVSDGTPQTPKVSIVYGEKILVEGVDYTLSYRDNVSYGVGTVVISGCGEYHDVVEQTFTIRPGCVCTLDIESGVRQAKPIEYITYDASWADDSVSNATVRISLNGTAIWTMSGAGTVTWTPKETGTYTFTHVTKADDEIIGETLSATFNAVRLLPERPTISPESGRIFSGNLSITMACATEDVTIHYTTDGTTPTIASPTYKRFRIYTKTTVKAIAFYDDGTSGEMAVAEYALGQCADPVISMDEGSVFHHSDQNVTIDCGSDGVVHYTTDGSEPTVDSPIYDGQFPISETTTVKAKAASASYFDSQVVTATFTREWQQVATPTISVAETFIGSRTMVELACDTDDVTLYYTLDGSDPTTLSMVYDGEFAITNTCIIKVLAMRNDYKNSDIVSVSVTKEWCVGDALNMPNQDFALSGDVGWTNDTKVAHDGIASLRSGSIENNQTSVFSTILTGRGVVSFWWKTDCEDAGEDENGERYCDYDHVEFSADGTIYKLDGDSGWQKIEHTFNTDGEHNLVWTYVKDGVEKDGDDCAWVDEIVWMPEDPIPDIGTLPTDRQVSNAIIGSSDEKLVERIIHGDQYNAYRTWANKLEDEGISHKAVKESKYSWLSFALDSDKLITKEPEQKDLKVDGFEPSDTDGAFDLTVKVENVNVGSEADKDNLKKIFGIEGGISLDEMSADDVDVSFGTPVGGKVKVTASPKDASANSFFMRVKMNP